MFGEKALTGWMAESRAMPAAELCDALMARLDAYGGGKRDDDVSIFSFQRSEHE
ncbi:MAG: SpoIIE family protein phosphatase [Mariprofundaceae bacterium]|nr:SpoIIE family protein phosphatase [Mariprofundaceae bacterium]